MSFSLRVSENKAQPHPFSLSQLWAMGSDSPLASAPVPASPSVSVGPLLTGAKFGRDKREENSGPLGEMALLALIEPWAVFQVMGMALQ